MKVLLVEDDALMRKMIAKTILSRFPDIEFVECPSVPEAKEAYDGGMKFDFALVDFELIQGTGYDVVNHIRVERKDKLLPIMMCTSHQDRKTVLKMLELGVNDYLAKPFQPKKIIEKVERLVERGQRIRESIERRKQQAANGDQPTPAPSPITAAAAAASTASVAPVAATSAPATPAPKGTEPKKGSAKHGELGDGIIDDSDSGSVEYIDLKNTTDDEEHIEVSDDMFL
ncbi:MAG: response regulator [Nitrospinae bacterium]|nr:response regulator [Nitrospinota bacterium]